MALDPITQQSFAQIDAELAVRGVRRAPAEHALLRRAIHASADFELIDTLRLHPAAIAAGIAALRRGARVVTDVRMVLAGLDRQRLARLGAQALCRVDTPATARLAQALGLTRSAAGLRRALAAAGSAPIVVIGNAPTALREVLRLIAAGDAHPALVIGVPVGFVDAAESKAALMELAAPPWISLVGRKGGSPIAAALLNALLRLALEEDDG